MSWSRVRHMCPEPACHCCTIWEFTPLIHPTKSLVSQNCLLGMAAIISQTGACTALLRIHSYHHSLHHHSADDCPVGTGTAQVLHTLPVAEPALAFLSGRETYPRRAQQQRTHLHLMLERAMEKMFAGLCYRECQHAGKRLAQRIGVMRT
jgi:hypothetical protein